MVRGAIIAISSDNRAARRSGKINALKRQYCLAASRSMGNSYLMATALGGDAMPPSRFIGTDTIMNS